MYADIIEDLIIKTKYDDVEGFHVDLKSNFCIKRTDGTDEQLFPITESLFDHEFLDIVDLVRDRLAILANVSQIYNQRVHDLVVDVPHEQVHGIFIDETVVKFRFKDGTTQNLFEFDEIPDSMLYNYVMRQICRKLNLRTK